MPGVLAIYTAADLVVPAAQVRARLQAARRHADEEADPDGARRQGALRRRPGGCVVAETYNQAKDAAEAVEPTSSRSTR